METNRLDYGVQSVPSFTITFFYVIQLILSNLSGTIGATFIIYYNLCAHNYPVLLAELLGTAIFMGGLATVLQVGIGVRLPITQGSAWSYLPPIIAMMNTDQWKCSTDNNNNDTCAFSFSVENSTSCVNDKWSQRLNEINGGLIVASIVHMIIGASGIMGCMMRFIGPLTVIPTVALLGLSLYESVANSSQHSWGIAVGTATVYIMCSVVLHRIKIPFPSYKRGKGFYKVHIKLFRLYPSFIAISTMWIICYILTTCNVFPDDPDKRGFMARTDAKLDNVKQMKWFFIPYPGRYGWPTFSLGMSLGMLSAAVCSIVESTGDYYATARVCGVPVPAEHALNRGILVEGFSSLISGLVGAGHATTSYSGNVGIIAVTKFGSRHTWVAAGLFQMTIGLIGKFGGSLSIIPDPVIGGTSLIGLGMLVGVSLSNLRFIDLNSTRNLLILGVSLLIGLIFPFWIKDNPGIINTGSSEFDQVLIIFLSTGMLVGGVSGFILDNLIPGSEDERGMLSFITSDNQTVHTDSKDMLSTVYDLPYVTSWLKQKAFCSYIPFMPSYLPRECCCVSCTWTKLFSYKRNRVLPPEVNSCECDNDITKL